MIDWTALESLAEKLAMAGQGPGSVPDSEWQLIEQALRQLRAAEKWADLVHLRRLFKEVYAGDTAWGLPLLQELDGAALEAARHSQNLEASAHLLGARGHNLHRQGYHEEAIEVFTESAALYEEIEEPFQALKNYHMTSLCHRALGRRREALEIVGKVLAGLPADNPWRGNPLQVQAWLVQDAGRLEEAEGLLEQALAYHRQAEGADILIAGALADLGEIQGLLDRAGQAEATFQESINILGRYGGQYERQAARTRLKLAELLMRRGRHREALGHLNEADDQVRLYGHYYDLMWRIELARAFIFFRLGNLRSAGRKFRAALRYRRELDLPLSALLRQLLKRFLQGTGLPR